ncbi:MAG TPA: hypothetical protein VGK32_10045 [Vicinamibacterales bacterium]|jgi:hypothetical protein
MDPAAEIKKLYRRATRATIARDLDKAIDLLKTIDDEDERDRVAVFMDGLAQMRAEWRDAVAPQKAGRRGGGQAESPEGGQAAKVQKSDVATRRR